MRPRTCWLSLTVALSLACPGRAELLPEGLTLYGFVETRVGFWTQSHPTQPLIFPGITEEPDDDPWAVARGTLQVEADWQLAPTTELHAVLRGALEPRYEVDKFANRGSHFGDWQLARSEYNDPPSAKEIFRELWLRHDLRPGHTLRVGRQVVNWGESLAFRVADVINPNDSRTSLFFLDPEDSRIPQWMVQGLHQFPDAPLAPAFEWIVIPPLDPEDRRVDDLAPTGSRFAPPPETRPSRFPYFAARGLPALWTVQRAAARGGAVDFRFLDERRWDFPDEWRYGERVQLWAGPLQLAFYHWAAHELLPVVEDRGLSPFVIADYDGVLHRPDLSRAYSSLGIPEAAKPVIPLVDFRFRYPRQHVVGMTGNAYLPWLRGVARFEFAWRPNKWFQVDGFNGTTGVITDGDGLIRRDEVQWNVALDLGGIYWPRLNPRGDFTFNLELQETIVLDHEDEMRFAVYETRLRAVRETISLRGATLYFGDKLRPSLLWVMQPREEAWAVVAALGLTWPWDERITGELRYVTVGGDDFFDGLGVFRRKDFAMFFVRYEF